MVRIGRSVARILRENGYQCGGFVYDEPDQQAEFELTPYSLREVLESVAARHFPEITELPPVQFSRVRRLAYINNPQLSGSSRRYIVVSSAFNSSHTDRAIIEAVLAHELLHIRIPPREVDGEMKDHPPEFFEREREISPRIGEVWGWIHVQFEKGLMRIPGREGYMLRARFLREVVRERKRFSMAQVAEILR